MVYIFVGPDGAGKSTAFNVIQKEYAIGNAHFVKEDHPRDLEEKLARIDRLRDLLLDEDRNDVYVFDRHTAIDDIVYGSLLDGGEDGISYGMVEGLLRRCTVFYFYSNSSILQKRLEERGDEYVNANMIDDIIKRYNTVIDMLEMSGCKVFRINTSYDTPYDIAAKVVRYIGARAQKFAHIVPVSGLHLLDGKQYLMCLAHLVLSNQEYASYYANRAKDRGTYVLLDNGAAEGVQPSIDDLLKAYSIIHPSEIILPDTLYDADDTLRKFKGSLDIFVDRLHLPYKTMAVPQGSDFEQWKMCAEKMIQDGRINSLGISKFLHMANEYNDIIRHQAAAYIGRLMNKYKRYDIEVHLLGCSEPLYVVSDIFKSFDFVRGCDSALAYIYAQSNVHPYACTKRPSGEIDFIHGECPVSLETCMSELEIAAGVRDNRRHDPSWTIASNRCGKEGARWQVFQTALGSILFN